MSRYILTMWSQLTELNCGRKMEKELWWPLTSRNNVADQWRNAAKSLENMKNRQQWTKNYVGVDLSLSVANMGMNTKKSCHRQPTITLAASNHPSPSTSTPTSINPSLTSQGFMPTPTATPQSSTQVGPTPTATPQPSTQVGPTPTTTPQSSTQVGGRSKSHSKLPVRRSHNWIVVALYI